MPRRTPAPAPAAALRQPSRSATLPPRRPTVPPPRSEERGHGWILPAALGVLVLAAAVFGATQLIGGDDAPAPRTPASDQAAETPDGGGSAPEPTQAALTRESAKLAVLNGTTVEGLASNQADTLKTAGYTGAITTGNNTEQRVQSTVLYGDGARSLARDVARRLTIASVAPLDADTRALGEDADIVVILGQDKAP